MSKVIVNGVECKGIDDEKATFSYEPNPFQDLSEIVLAGKTAKEFSKKYEINDLVEVKIQTLYSSYKKDYYIKEINKFGINKYSVTLKQSVE